jgi:MinD-like ATPase involved in chromosome partitioning or flagellar assembly
MLNTRRGRVITFYSYKGGVGRSMALANIAALLAKWKQRVLVLDWDLEAPGIEKFFETDSPKGRGRELTDQRAKTPGIVDLIEGLESGRRIHWRDCLLTADPSGSGTPLSIISAGRDEPEYANRVRSLDWEKLFAEYDFGEYLESLRKEWIAEYDFVLVDSRTGVTDAGGVCSIHLPDIVVAMFTANQQSVEGVKRVLMSLRASHEQLQLDRFRLQLVPLPGRDESVTEHEKSQEWREIFASELAEFYLGWLPAGYSPRQVLERLKIPYKPYWSFGERLPVILEGSSDPASVGYAYAILAKLIVGDLDWQSVAAEEDPTRDGKPVSAGRRVPTVPPPRPAVEAAALSARPVSATPRLPESLPAPAAPARPALGGRIVAGAAALVGLVGLLTIRFVFAPSVSTESTVSVLSASPVALTSGVANSELPGAPASATTVRVESEHVRGVKTKAGGSGAANPDSTKPDPPDENVNAVQVVKRPSRVSPSPSAKPSTGKPVVVPALRSDAYDNIFDQRR